ncbi:RNA polymerase RpoN-/SigL-like sigma 54 subunit [Rhodothalassium salexigens DSM 2132]|uniref:RNA polymerase sigma-54 factor n=1 Tax=Rhodothalassium salexigens DSM 2132 TaxID=1188247 RepID=A0A4R2PH25_RHOSA|nr:RNA polymerase factor sigma-54 [Rhodothalassium salexigens]MBB4211531.1 RNA polymerase sigma-54 factor [Rhodothalassium salexigens DSM 2132]MBK1639854.1 RNA polymerase sigma-54 factor [Rhodothalassium salexigens DSM 2132]TCP34537.1 RNA polymerase RpoN-/SigL-like sigma 54 subunit [Rhodothalassium salexigens DSM 2132]
MDMIAAHRQTQGQGLVMTARMQASLRILQMSNLDLADHLAEEALSNPCLEVTRPEPVPARPQGAMGAHNPDWDPVAGLESTPPSLYEHVARQVALTFQTADNRRLAMLFAEALEPTGWLGRPLDAIAAGARISMRRASAMLARLQRLEPAGLFARDLAECLRLQADDRGFLTWDLAVILDNLALLAEGRLAELAALCDGTVDDVRTLAGLIQTLDPKPGLAFAAEPAPPRPPDLSVRRGDAGWVVDIERSTLPVVTIVDGPRTAGDAEAQAHLAHARAQARWLKRTVDRRQNTLLRTAAALVRRQRAFLDQGPNHLRPLTTHDLAGELALHPTTISRAVADRLIATPHGTLPLRSFFVRAFTPGAGTDGPSQDAVVALVGRIVDAEDTARPLSDAAIAERARRAGIPLARRTVAKYRDMLGIPSSYTRRQPPAAPA